MAAYSIYKIHQQAVLDNSGGMIIREGKKENSETSLQDSQISCLEHYKKSPRIKSKLCAKSFATV
jgi:hypothetical protein